MAHNSNAVTIPTEGLCLNGTASDALGSKPWTWTCFGQINSIACTTALLGTQTNPAKTCESIIRNNQSLGTGYYWIDPDGAGPLSKFQAYCDMVSDGGGWIRVDGNTASSSIGFGTNGLLRAKNRPRDCGEGSINFLLSNFKINYFKYRMYLTRETTIHQCSAVTNAIRHSYENNGNWISSSTCTWGDGIWARACCNVTLYSELKKNWLFEGNYSSSLAYSTQCSGSTDNGYFTVYMYIK